MAEELREPAWLTAKADQRLAMMIDATGDNFPQDAIVTTPLTEPEPGQEWEQWDRGCDNCGVYVPEGQLLWTGHVLRITPKGSRVIINFGACAACKNA